MFLFTLAYNVLIPAQQFSDAIEDNSFFIEEAYNQEYRVVQHIFNAVFFTKPSKDAALSFTQEWPFFSEKHQLSYTIPYSSLSSGSVSGIGDIMINYRYQLFYKDDWAAVSPRLSIIIPTGSFNKGLGNDVFGYQFNFPVSKRFSDFWVVHFNLGLSYIPNVKGYSLSGIEVKQNLLSYFTGASLIYLFKSDLNFLLEYLLNYSNEINDEGKTNYTTENIVSPGIRYEININNLQIVPGIAVPVSITKETTRTGLFFYLSFEHPF
jgi:hypothetical protein